jgi:uncharacterized repeat protein (TIGR03803 family)
VQECPRSVLDRGYEPRGNGTVFEVSPRGTLTTLYRFCSQGTYPNACSDGYYPVADLIQASNGDLYGTTSQGGANGSVGGTVFKINPTGKLTTFDWRRALQNEGSRSPKLRFFNANPPQDGRLPVETVSEVRSS